jgi:chloride channel 3/4/5
MTYFPNPATFPNGQTLSTSPPNIRSTMQGQGQGQGPSRTGSIYNDTTGERTPTRLAPTTPVSSPQTRRDTAHSSRRRESSVNPNQRSVTIAGYGATGNTSALGLGLGANPDRDRHDVLSSPRRISTSHASGSQHPHPHPHPPSAYSRRAHSPANLILPSHEAYYSQTQPSSAATARFRERERDRDRDRDRDFTHTRNSQSQDQSPFLTRFNVPDDPRMASGTSAETTSRALRKSPSGSVMKRLKSRASICGISLGKPDKYDKSDAEDADDESEVGDVPSVNNNGMRVWYR